MKVINSIADLRAIARRRVPKSIFEYVDHGSYDELTLARNRSDFDALQFRQRVLIDVARQSLRTTIFGQEAAIPLVIAPTGMTGLVHADGEILAAQAAEAFGIPFTLSTVSICSIEDVRAAVKQPFWFQLYVMKDRGYTEVLLDRAHAAGCPLLQLTVDIPVSGLRRRDAKNGLAVPPKLTLKNALDIATKPAWATRVLFGKRKTFGNLVDRMPHTGLATLSQWISTQFDASVTWKDIEWVRARWPGKLVIKGVLDAEDARQAANMGVDGVIVSNHGGRQLDGASSTIAALPAVVEAVQGRCEVALDGGIRCGQDVLKAVALGARAAMTGRAFLYGLGADGRNGVKQAIEIIARELQVSLALSGCNDILEAGPQLLLPRR
ncbi:MAG: alpha-hydroxy acid oxidase [Steroidobacteraceae bacterium]